MNHKLVAKVLGALLVVEGLALLLPALVSFAYQDGALDAFLMTAVIAVLLGIPLLLRDTAGMHMKNRDGFASAGLGWIVLAAVGALPYVFSGAAPSYIDALFETVSGFTTTGASIIADVEALAPSVQFWRTLTNWMGGMGVLVMLLALLPQLGDGSVNLMRAESPGPVLSKLVPRVADTAQILYMIYIGLTVAETAILWALGMPLFDSVNHAMATIATGGFSLKNASIAFYDSPAIYWVITVFMFLSGINFALLYQALRGRFREAVKSEELWLYVGVILGAIALITLDLYRELGTEPLSAATQAAFQTVTVVTTTGFATTDFAVWPAVSQCVLILLMLMGGCAGSTAGGMKSIRLLLLLKSTRRWLQRILHPREVHPIRVDGRSTEEETVTNVSCFFFAYMAILMCSTVIIGLDHVDFLEAFSAALTSISNVGPALGILGPTGNFAALNGVSKLTMSVAMLFGRLEIVPLMIVLMPSAWRKR